MSRSIRTWFLSVVSLLSIAPICAIRDAAAQAAGERIFRPESVERLMTAEERRATGVMRLTPAARRALAAWVARRTAAVVAVDRDARWRAAAMRAPAVSAPAGSAGGPVRVSLVPATTVVSWAVQAVREGGRFVDLDDGTTWEIAPTRGFDRSLTNAEAYRNAQAFRSVAARFAGRTP